MAIKTPTYQRSVGLRSVNAPQLQSNNAGSASISSYAHSMDGIAKGIDSWAQVRQKEVEDDIANGVVAAQTEYKTQIRDLMNNQENGLLTRKGEYAAGIDQEFQKREQEIRKNIMKNLPAYEKAQTVFGQMADEYAGSSMATIGEYQGKQKAEYRKLTFNNATDAVMKDMTYNNPASIQQGIFDIERLGKMYALKDLGEEGYKAYINGQKEAISTMFANQAYQAQDWDGMDKVLKQYGKHMDPNTLAKFNGILKGERDKDDVYRSFDSIKGMFMKPDGTFDSEAAGKYIDSQFGPNSTKMVTKKIGGVKNVRQDIWNAALYVQERTGINAKFIYAQWANESTNFTSRLAKENYNFGGLTQVEPNGEDNKQPDGGNYYKEYKSIQEYAKDYVDKFIGLYEGTENVKTVEDFTRYLYDNGYYTDDVDKYTNNVKSKLLEIDDGEGQEVTETVSNFNRDKYDRLMQMAKAFGAETRQNIAIKKADELERVQNGMANLDGNPTAQFELIDSSFLPEHVKYTLRKNLEKALEPKPRKQSDFGAKAMLLKLKAKGELTEQDVINNEQFLTQADCMTLLSSAYEIDSGKDKKETSIADKKWQAYLENDGPYAKNSKKNNQLVVEITDMLNQGGVVGEDRYSVALERIKQEKESEGSILNYTSNNNAQKESLYQDFDPRLVDLAEQGLKRSGDWSGNYQDVNVLLSFIGSQISDGDEVAQHAVDMMINDGVGINMATWNEYYDAAGRDLN